MNILMVIHLWALWTGATEATFLEDFRHNQQLKCISYVTRIKWHKGVGIPPYFKDKVMEKDTIYTRNGEKHYRTWEIYLPEKYFKRNI